MLDLLSVGAIKLDTFIVLPEASVLCELKKPDCKLCIEYGKKIPVESFVTQIAGSAPNVAVGLARMNCKTAVMSFMGDDPVYHQAIAFLKAHKVSPSQVKKQKGFHSSAAVVLNYKGESTQLVDHVPHTYRLPKTTPACRFIHISELGGQYEPLYKDAIWLAKKKGAKISFNPGSVQLRERKKELLDLIAVTEVLFLNLFEARQLIQHPEDDIRLLMTRLKAMGPHYVVVTDGKNGAYAFDGQQLDFVPIFPGDFKEATGAGDAFATGFLGGLLKGKAHREALKWGAANASSVVGAVGPTSGLLSHLEIQKRLKKHPSFKSREL